MLEVKAEELGRVTIVHVEGRILNGNTTRTLQEAVFAQPGVKMLVLDLAHVDLIDAGGLGALLELREWTLAKGIEFKLMNLVRRVQHVFEITRLDYVFEITSEDLILTATTGLTSVMSSDKRSIEDFRRSSVAS